MVPVLGSGRNGADAQLKMEYLSGAQMAPPIMSYPRNLSYLKNICSVLVTLEISIRSCSLFGREPMQGAPCDGWGKVDATHGL